MHSRLCQAVQWASHKVTKSGETPTGSACYLCAAVAAHSFGAKSWADVSTAKSSPDFAKTVSEAREQLQARKGVLPQKPWLAEELNEQIQIRVKMCRSLIFLSISEFEEKYGTRVGDYGPGELHIEEVKDEQGNLTKGVCMVDPQAPHRKLVLEAEMSKVLVTSLGERSEMLRAQQHSDMMSFLVQDAAKKQCRSFKSPPTEDEMRKLAEKVSARVEAQQKSGGSGTLDALAPLETPSKGKRDEDDMKADSPDGQVVSKVGPNLGQMLLQQQAAQSEKQGRGRPKAKARGTERGASATEQPAKKKARTSAQALGLQPDSASVGSSHMESSSQSTRYRLGSKTSSKTPLEKLIAGYQKWREELSLSEALIGNPQKNANYQARRVVSGFQERGMQDSTECIRLKTRVDLAEKCLAASQIGEVPAEKREALLSEVCAAVEYLPAGFQKVLLEQSVKDLGFNSIADVKRWIEIVQPRQEGAKSMHAPQLSMSVVNRISRTDAGNLSGHSRVPFPMVP